MIYNGQTRFDIRCEWGEQSVTALAADSDAVIIVDVLSFSTCVAIAVHNGAIVYPFHSNTMTAQDYAREKDALLAVKQRNTKGYSLSPLSLMTIPAQTKIVLPSPNGSLLSTLTGNKPTFTGCLRNARAVALAAQKFGIRITVIPAGERWFATNSSLRPALEDTIGAGAIIHYLSGKKSMEAQAAESTFLQFRNQLQSCFKNIGSGIELIDKGFAKDVELAAELNVSDKAPRLRNSAYRALLHS